MGLDFTRNTNVLGDLLIVEAVWAGDLWTLYEQLRSLPSEQTRYDRLLCLVASRSYKISLPEVY